MSANTNDLDAFVNATDPQNLESIDIKAMCDSWELSVKNDVITSTISPCHVIFVPGKRMSFPNLPDIGRLRISRPTTNYATGKISQIVYGTHGSRKGELGWPSRVAVCPVTGNIVVIDPWTSRVQIFNANGQFLSMFEKFDFDTCTSTGGIAITNQQQIAVCDNHRVQLFTGKGKHLRTIGFPVSHGSFSDYFRGMSCHQDHFYICDPEYCQILVIKPNGVVTVMLKTGKAGPYDVAVCPNREIIVTYDDELHVHHADGSHKARLGGEPGSVTLERPWGVTVDNEGHVIVTDRGTHQVHVLEQSGKLIRTFGSLGKEPGQFETPISAACTQDGRIVVVDRDNHRIQVFTFD